MITCWRINSTAPTSWHRRSDIWIDATNYNGDDSFCATHVHDPLGRSPEDGAIFCLVNETKSASLLDENLVPMNHDRGGQVFASYSMYHYFRPIAYRRWDPVRPLRLITKVQVVENNTHFPTSCPYGTIEGGNYNDGCDQDPFVALCMHYNEGVRVRVHDMVADNDSVEHVTNVHLTPSDSKTTNATCSDGMEAVSSAENPMQPFKFRTHMNSFFLLCLSRSRAVVDNHIIKKRFVSRIFVNADRERPLRVEYERNDAIEWIHRSELKSEVLVNADFGCE
ncbi:hypothetical protein FI667_g7565, partial [Globisporangium splendens]